MFRSMTAYGQASIHSDLGHFTVEIQSVNRKFLEINIVLPKELSRFEVDMKKWFLHHVSRGQVTVKVFANFENRVPFLIRPNILLAKQLKNAWEEIADAIGADKREFSLSFLAQNEGIISLEENVDEEEAYKVLLKNLFDTAMHGFSSMKKQEGALLQIDVLNRLQQIHSWMVAIEKRTPYATDKYRHKLISRLEELIPGHVENEDRILRELALFADKIDITEEITRFFCHLTRCEEIIHSSQISIGKTLDFILQELNREINTIGSKSADIEIARLIIDIKSELERVREQIQNIE